MNKLLAELNKDLEFQRLKELSKYFKENRVIIDYKKELAILNKALVKAKIACEPEKITKIEQNIENLSSNLKEKPFVVEYLDLLADFKEKLGILKQEIEQKIENNIFL